LAQVFAQEEEYLEEEIHQLDDSKFLHYNIFIPEISFILITFELALILLVLLIRIRVVLFYHGSLATI